ncbi:hypothetical protein T10_2446 [Trichinella papuae]|uniref:Apple domain-containing protein n=1 Tax=Trichinella papuae TaxID=268474 RepID=A0A0V1MH06_9BILA|nr:hypothetical protein T10_2446 [Trichinella papuae]
MRYYLKETGEICVLEFYNLTRLSGFDLFELLENVENIKSCIYACRRKYETHLCLAINYTMKKQCILFKKESIPTVYIVEPQSVFAEILLCEEGTLTCKSTLFAAYLNDAQMTCILDERKVNSSLLQSVDIQTVLGKSFEECITMCYLLPPDKKCNAVKYFQTLMKCYLFAIHINVTELEAEDESFAVTYIYGCTKGSYYLHEIGNYSKLVFGGTFISLQARTLDKKFIIERRPIVDSMHSKILLNDQTESIVSCIVSCYVMRIGCNAVLYNTRAGWCTLLKHETPTLPVTVEQYERRLMFLLHLTLPWDVKVNSIIIKVTHNISYELRAESRATTETRAVTDPRTEQRGQTSTVLYVHLYRYLEICEINVIHNRIIENVTSIQMISNVRSVNKCLHFCRPWLRQLFYCAIIYTRHNYQCELLIRNTERSNAYFVDGENNLIELLNCYPDRQSERRNNPPPMQYYLKETGEICVLEFYNSTQLSGFNPIETLENVGNIKSCIYACRQLCHEDFCQAISYTTKKQCTLLRKVSYRLLYNVESQSLFAEILFCEPGTFMTCVLDQLKLSSSSLVLYEMRILWGKSFDECILMCNSLRPENKCNAIKYYQNLKKCYLLAAHINSITTETQHGSYNVIIIYGCLKGTFISLQIEILNKTLIIERRPTVDSIHSKIIENDQKQCTADCLVTCYAKSWQTGCNAVVYNNRTSLCTLLKHETPTPPITFIHHEMTLMLLLHLTLPWDVKVNSVAIKTTHNISYELISESRATIDSEGISGPSTEQAERTSTEAFVHLYRYMEICKINKNRKCNKRSNNTKRPISKQMPTFLSTMASHNYKCELLKRNTERSSTRFVDGESNFIELLNCHADRQSERRNNPSPMRYYLKKTGEICVLEFFNATQLSGFTPIETLENVENIKSCIYACRLRYSSYICLAINYTMKKQCTLLRHKSNNDIYNVESQSLFAEILFCEPGTFVDEIYNF